jgi:hypothetical protein
MSSNICKQCTPFDPSRAPFLLLFLSLVIHWNREEKLTRRVKWKLHHTPYYTLCQCLSMLANTNTHSLCIVLIPKSINTQCLNKKSRHQSDSFYNNTYSWIYENWCKVIEAMQQAFKKQCNKHSRSNAMRTPRQQENNHVNGCHVKKGDVQSWFLDLKECVGNSWGPFLSSANNRARTTGSE